MNVVNGMYADNELNAELAKFASRVLEDLTSEEPDWAAAGRRLREYFQLELSLHECSIIETARLIDAYDILDDLNDFNRGLVKDMTEVLALHTKAVENADKNLAVLRGFLPAETREMTPSPEECVLAIRDGIYQCARSKHRHGEVGEFMIGKSADTVQRLNETIWGWGCEHSEASAS